MGQPERKIDKLTTVCTHTADWTEEKPERLEQTISEQANQTQMETKMGSKATGETHILSFPDLLGIYCIH